MWFFLLWGLLGVFFGRFFFFLKRAWERKRHHKTKTKRGPIFWFLWGFVGGADRGGDGGERGARWGGASVFGFGVLFFLFGG